jgi:hypothetical protein
MGLIGKIKQMLGIGTIKVKLTIPGNVKADEGSIKGSMTLTAKSDQKVKFVQAELEETYTKGKGDDKKETKFKLGKWDDQTAFEMKAGEVKTIEFNLPFALLKSDNDQLAESGGVMGGIGKLAKFATGEKSEYAVIATVDVIGASLDPNDIVDIKIVK